MGSTCEAGCKAIVRIQLDQLQADGTLDASGEAAHHLHRPAIRADTSNKVEGDVLIVGDCAKGMLEKFPNAQYWGECEEYPNCTPIWANRPDVGIANYVRQLTAVREGHAGIRRMGSPSAVLNGLRIARPEPIPRTDYLLRQGVLKLLAVKDSDIRILTLEQCRDAVDKGLHAGGAFSA